MAFTLTLLGTDTVYSPDAGSVGYAKGETLSFVAKLIENKGEIAKTEISPYATDSVEVIIGPTTLGTEVGDRIARGILAILMAIKKDQTDINLIAHSRGAVEAILITHEIERIQQACQQISNNKRQINLQEILLNTPCKYTKLAILQVFKNEDYKKIERGLVKKIKNVELNLFAIDPVPGGKFWKIPAGHWRDDRFYYIPEIVKECKLIIYENERTHCFKPIIPKQATGKNNQFELITLPGHHGTGSGNFSCQQQIREAKSETEHVQQLLIHELLEFLDKHGVSFNLSNIEDIHPLKDVAKFATDKNLLSTKKRLEIYNEIQKNLLSYRAFNKTSYAYLKQDTPISKSLDPRNRLVHYHQHTITELATLLSALDDSFVNVEHAKLWIFDHFGLNDTAKPAELINDLTNKLKDGLADLSQYREAEVKNATSSSLEDSVVITRHESSENLEIKDEHFDLVAKKSLDKKRLFSNENINFVLDGIGVLTDTISQAYLEKSLDKRDKLELLQAINRIFEFFADSENNETYTKKELVYKISNKFKDSLNSTVDKKCNILKKSVDELVVAFMKSKVKFYDDEKVKNILKNYLFELEKFSNVAEINESHHEFIENLNELLEKVESSENNNFEILNKFYEYSNIFVTKLKEIERDDTKEIVLNINKLISEFYHVSESLITKNTELKDVYLEKFEEYFIELSAFNEDLDALHMRREKLDFNLDYFDKIKEIKEKQELLISEAANYLIDNKLDLTKKPDSLKDEKFFERVSCRAMELGLENPRDAELAMLKNRLEVINENNEKIINDLNQKISDLEEKNKKFIAERNKLEEMFDLLERNSLNLYKANDALVQEKADLENDKNNAESKNKDNEQRINDLNQKIIGLEEERENFTLQQKILKEKFDLLEKEKSNLVSDYRVLINEKEKLEEYKDSIDYKNNENKSTTLDLKQKIVVLKKEIEIFTHEQNIFEDKIASLENDYNNILFAHKSLIIEIEKHKTINGRLEDEIKCCDIKINNSNKKVSELDVENKKLAEKNQDLIESSNSLHEAKCLLVIKEKLLPLTSNYLSYLLVKLKLYPEHTGIDVANYSQAIDKAPLEGNDYALLFEKYEKALSLYNILNNHKVNYLASQRVENFYKDLIKADKDLKQHRSHSWHRYMTNALVIASVCLTGIIPGLIALKIYSSYSPCKSLSFWRSRGDVFLRTCRQVAAAELPTEVKEKAEEGDANPSSSNPRA